MVQTRKWSYSEDPSTTDRDWIRFKIRDTNPGEPLLYDAEIDALLAEHTVRETAAAHAALAVLGTLSSLVTESLSKGDKKEIVNYSDRATAYRENVFDVLNDMAGDVIGSSVVPTDIFVGGISRQDRETFREDTDLLRPSFRRGMFDDKRPEDCDPDREECCD